MTARIPTDTALVIRTGGTGQGLELVDEKWGVELAHCSWEYIHPKEGRGTNWNKQDARLEKFGIKGKSYWKAPNKKPSPDKFMSDGASSKWDSRYHRTTGQDIQKWWKENKHYFRSSVIFFIIETLKQFQKTRILTWFIWIMHNDIIPANLSSFYIFHRAIRYLVKDSGWIVRAKLQKPVSTESSWCIDCRY